ncbi:auxin-responsive protein IAA4-like isoform X2 [Typha angustifolia]|uniref:auxin-responsive protein IAA4-like isoform X2 n=1 Tax=Typha angustifolia TaxID=59011 RepID=UPI003C2FA446
MGGEGDSPSSSIDSSSSHPGLSSTSALSQPRSRDLTTELRLGLSLSPSSLEESSLNSRSTLSEKSNQDQPPTFFVKVYMEGIPIGRKLDLFAHDGYNSLIRTLCRMFRTAISYPDMDHMPSNKTHVLTYEDKEGDWMMVGDVPWELFLTTVKRLMISRADKC